MPFERPLHRYQDADAPVSTFRPTTPSPIDAAPLLTEYEWGMVRKLPLLKQERRELVHQSRECKEQFEVAAQAYKAHHPENDSSSYSIESWGRAEAGQPAVYGHLLQELLLKASRFLSRDALLLVRMREEARDWVAIQRKIQKIDGLILTITPFARQVGRE